MAFAELAFEALLGALESVRGTKIDPATFYLNMQGTLTPRQTEYRPNESRGTLAEFYRSKAIRKWSELSASGPLDVLTLPFWLEQLVKAPGVIATPGGGTLSRTHTYAPTMTSDNLLSSTVYWGDPGIVQFQSAFFMPDEMVFTANSAGGTDGAQMSVTGMGQFPAKDASNSVPAMLNASLVAPSDMLLWIDTATIGTTAITGRVVSAEVKIVSGVTRKWLASGPSGGTNFNAVGRKKRHAEMKLVLELPDATQYDQWVAHTTLKTRLQMNGALIEGALYNYVQFDIYGPLSGLDWGELEGTNRNVELTILSEYDATAAFDFQVVVQNDRATI